MPVATLADVLDTARKRRIGVPNLWAGSMEKILGHIRAAEEMDMPLSLCFVRALCPELPLEFGFGIMIRAAARARVPVAVILDHGMSLEECVQAIRAGASGVMYDGSHLTFEENIQNTRDVVRVAHAAGVSVEAELGTVGGSAVEYETATLLESSLTDPNDAVTFVEETGTDALAISVGNSHGEYKGPPAIRHDLIREIRARVSVPLVMHGASGLPDSEYPRIVESGISKINYYTAMSLAAADEMKAFLAHGGGQEGCHNIIRHMIEWYAGATRQLLQKLRTQGDEFRTSDQTTPGDISREQIAAVVADVLKDYGQQG